MEHIRFSNENGVARLTLARPPLNILHIPMMQEMVRALGGVRQDATLRALVIQAEGKAFSAGVAVEDHVADRVRGMLDTFHEVFRILHGLDIPTVAVVQGAALGGGAELATFCDVVIAGERATVGQPETKLGVFPPIAAWCYPRRVGPARARGLILSGEALPAREAERIGLVDRVVKDEELKSASDAVVAQFAAKSAVALRMAKRALRAAQDRPFEEVLPALERTYLNDLMATEDAAEGLRSFLEKRPPVWKHR